MAGVNFRLEDRQQTGDAVVEADVEDELQNFNDFQFGVHDQRVHLQFTVR